MKCADLNDRLPEFADGGMPTEARREIERHLRGCPACAETWQTVRALSATVPPVPGDLEARIRAAVHAEVAVQPDGVLSLEAGRGAARSRLRPPAWMLAAAALLVLAVGTPSMMERMTDVPGPAGAEELAMAERTLTPSVWASDDGLIAGSPALDGLSDAALLALLEELEAGA
ncbi:MAG TPA: zf-HC2 domain-containing protein [Longimicrobiales bacterium]|nr:zf-HC2 domain-containing protein [Longimicrobiales bacterium]